MSGYDVPSQEKQIKIVGGERILCIMENSRKTNNYENA